MLLNVIINSYLCYIVVVKNREKYMTIVIFGNYRNLSLQFEKINL